MKLKSRAFILFGISIVVVACGGTGGGGSSTTISSTSGDTGGLISQDIDIRSQQTSSVVAFQDGDGAWAQLTPVGSGSNHYVGHVTNPKGRYSVAFGNRSLMVDQYTIADTITVREGGPVKPITGTQHVHAAPPADSMFFFSADLTQGTSLNETNANVGFGKSADIALGFYKKDYSSGSMKILRDLPRPSGLGNITFDTSSSDLVDLTLHTLNDTSAELYYITPSNGVRLELIHSGSGSTLSYLAPSKAQTPVGDKVFVISKASSADGVLPGWGAEVGIGFPSSQEVTALSATDFPALPSEVQIAKVTGPKKQYTISCSLPTGLRLMTAASTNLSFCVSKGWLGNVSSATYVTPDLSSIPAFASYYASAPSSFNISKEFSAANLAEGTPLQGRDRGMDPQIPGFRAGITYARIAYGPIAITP